MIFKSKGVYNPSTIFVEIMGIETDKFLPLEKNLDDQDDNGNENLVPPEVREIYSEAWNAYLRGEKTEAERNERINEALNTLELSNPEAYERLTEKDSQGKTPLIRLVNELQQERKGGDRSKMGQGKKPPKSERIHTRREKAAKRRGS